MTVRFGSCQGDDCGICLNSLPTVSLPEESNPVSQETPFSEETDWVGHAIVYSTAERVHAFHRSCLQEWFRTHNTCPTCRAVASIDSAPPPFIPESAVLSDALMIQLAQAVDPTRGRNPFVYLYGIGGSLMGTGMALMRPSIHPELSAEWYVCSFLVGAIFAAINSAHPGLSSGQAHARAPLYGALASYAFMILVLSTP
ncbi:MAG: RING finger domain-containing protein [Chlamydiota bacterium]